MTYCERIDNPQYRIDLAQLTKILGDSNAATAALESNNGFSLDKAPNGKDSFLYQSLYDTISEKYPDLSEDRINLINTALSVVGRVPYFWGGGHHQNLEPGIDLAWGVEQRVISADGYSSQPLGSYQLYGLDCSGFTRWAILTSTGSDTMYYGAEGQRTHCSSVSQRNLKPGDFANTSDDGHVGIYLYTENGKMYFVHCSPSVDGVGINAPGYFTKFYTPNGISK